MKEDIIDIIGSTTITNEINLFPNKIPISDINKETVKNIVSSINKSILLKTTTDEMKAKKLLHDPKNSQVYSRIKAFDVSKDISNENDTLSKKSEKQQIDLSKLSEEEIIEKVKKGEIFLEFNFYEIAQSKEETMKKGRSQYLPTKIEEKMMSTFLLRLDTLNPYSSFLFNGHTIKIQDIFKELNIVFDKDELEESLVQSKKEVDSFYKQKIKPELGKYSEISSLSSGLRSEYETILEQHNKLIKEYDMIHKKSQLDLLFPIESNNSLYSLHRKDLIEMISIINNINNVYKEKGVKPIDIGYSLFLKIQNHIMDIQKEKVSKTYLKEKDFLNIYTNFSKREKIEYLTQVMEKETKTKVEYTKDRVYSEIEMANNAIKDFDKNISNVFNKIVQEVVTQIMEKLKEKNGDLNLSNKKQNILEFFIKKIEKASPDKDIFIESLKTMYEKGYDPLKLVANKILNDANFKFLSSNFESVKDSLQPLLNGEDNKKVFFEYITENLMKSYPDKISLPEKPKTKSGISCNDPYAI